MSDYWIRMGDLVGYSGVSEYSKANNRMGIVVGVEGHQGDVYATYLVHWIGWLFPVPYKDWEIYKVDKK